MFSTSELEPGSGPLNSVRFDILCRSQELISSSKQKSKCKRHRQRPESHPTRLVSLPAWQHTTDSISVPPNCRFEVDDAEDEWTYSTKFDFVHMRGMMTCFRSPRSILQKAYDALQPGGYLEMQDGVFPLQSHDGSLDGTALDRWGKLCCEGGEKLGRAWTNTPNYARWMAEIGFEGVKERIFETPTNTWPRGREKKEWGIWFQADALEAVGASSALLTRVLGWTPEAVEGHVADVKRDLKNRAIHAYMPM
jgi:SAM-dependent methyltransferase